jgi:hypothetical protein
MTNSPARNWINGAFAAPMALSPSIDPVTYETIGSYADDGAPPARVAVNAAATAFRRTPWAHDAELRAPRPSSPTNLFLLNVMWACPQRRAKNRLAPPGSDGRHAVATRAPQSIGTLPRRPWRR